MELELIKYRDGGMATYTYFWKTEDGQMVGEFFDSELDALKWAQGRFKKEPREVDDARAEDEEFERIQKQNS